MVRPRNTYVPKTCACGCEEITTWYHGKPRKFINGHGKRNRTSGGYTRKGYICIRKPDHHFAGVSGYVLRSHLVYEEYHKCILLTWTVIHHKNGKKTDDRPANLEAKFRPSHAKLHLAKVPKKNMNNRSCLVCKSKKTTNRTFPSGLVRPIWHAYKNGFICHACYCHNRRQY